MEKQIYFKTLFLFVIFCEEIASLSDNYTISDESSDYLVRKKRLIDRTPDGNRPVSIQQVYYIVNLEENGLHVCAGSILSEFVIITAAHCLDRPARYTVRSGSAHVKRGLSHNIIRILRYPRARPFTFQSDFTLLTIEPSINLVHSPNRQINIYNGHIPPNTLLLTSGWGLALKRAGMDCFNGRSTTMGFPKHLRSITLPTISTEECRNEHDGDHAITDEVICTFDTSGQKRCGVGDGGNPLVMNGQLVGLMGWNAPGSPNIFVNLAYPEYRLWILSNLPHPHSAPHPHQSNPLPSPDSLTSSHSSSNSRNTFSPKSTSPRLREYQGHDVHFGY
ncbi:trypsin-7-like [Belonocnema kinseyi]|uniref:trypsin-7-like n=1 Tax=Belonocnema kinseyi TaxID=2817044 RepID=UPI00143D47F3|nr:trypsin-7-like [Belonocnema kinseyi]